MSEWMPFRQYKEYRYGGNIRAIVTASGKFRATAVVEDLENDPNVTRWLEEWQEWLADLAKSEEPPITAEGIFENENIKMQVHCTLDIMKGED